AAGADNAVAGYERRFFGSEKRRDVGDILRRTKPAQWRCAVAAQGGPVRADALVTHVGHAAALRIPLRIGTFGVDMADGDQVCANVKGPYLDSERFDQAVKAGL